MYFENSTGLTMKTNSRRHLLVTVGVFLLTGCIEFLFILFASGGHWWNWPASSDFYDQQADAFLHGQAALRQIPDPRLAVLLDPYARDARHGIDVPLDISYYQGQYFLYWGPVPAAGITIVHTGARIVLDVFHEPSRPASVIAFLRAAADRPIGDNLVTFVGASGMLLFLALILLRIRGQFFPHLKWWLLYGAIIAAAFGSPILWMLNRPMIYEAAIVSGQMFLLAGVYVILPVFVSRTCHPLRYGAAALLWTLALGSRLSLAGAVATLVVSVVILALRSSYSRRRLIATLVSLGVPLLVGIVFWGAFNQIRFGQPWESGFRYQLGALDYTKAQGAIFSARYTIFNLYNYFGRLVSWQAAFPFVLPVEGNPTAYPLSISRPAMYYVEPVTGLPFSSPFLFGMIGLCNLSFLLRIFRRDTQMSQTNAAGLDRGERTFRFWSGALCAAAILALIPLVVYWYCTERFLMDFVPMALILSACGAWRMAERMEAHGRWYAVGASLITGSAIWTAVANILLGVTGYGSHW
jgi:hypothetical protein